MSVKRAQREIDSAEFAEWMAYAVVEPFGPIREDQRAGMVAALIANVNRDEKKRSEPYGVEDFFPTYETAMAKLREQTQGPENLGEKILSWANRMKAASGVGKSRSELKPKPKKG